MLTLDDRTGNVLTTIALFAAVGAVAFAARATLVVFVLALLLAYLLEPVVSWVEGRLPLRSHSRVAAIAVVYIVGVLLVVGAGYSLEPGAARQLQLLGTAAPDMRARFASEPFLAEHSATIVSVAERMVQAVAATAEQAGWLLTVPIVAVFFLKNRAELIDGTVDVLAPRRNRASVKCTIEQIDTTLGQYARGQVALAGLSVTFYGASMALLGYPSPLAVALVGGVLEFLPVVGWILAAALILTSGWVAHANLMWMAILIVLWRLVQNFVTSPRIMGDRLQMDPMTVFLALMAGGQIGGLLGALLSLPVVAVLRILWLERSRRQNAAVA